MSPGSSALRSPCDVWSTSPQHHTHSNCTCTHYCCRSRGPLASNVLVCQLQLPGLQALEKQSYDLVLAPMAVAAEPGESGVQKLPHSGPPPAAGCSSRQLVSTASASDPSTGCHSSANQQAERLLQQQPWHGSQRRVRFHGIS